MRELIPTVFALALAIFAMVRVHRFRRDQVLRRDCELMRRAARRLDQRGDD